MLKKLLKKSLEEDVQQRHLNVTTKKVNLNCKTVINGGNKWQNVDYTQTFIKKVKNRCWLR